MILGTARLLELVKYQGLVENLHKRELETPEGAGFDLRLGELFRIAEAPDGSNYGFLGLAARRTPEVISVAKYEPGVILPFVIHPGDFLLGQTVERLNMPANLTANFLPRTTTFRSGLYLRTGNVAPGYCGAITFAIKGEGPVNAVVDLGARILHIQFYEVAGPTATYRGQWQGGRVAATEEEKQV